MDNQHRMIKGYRELNVQEMHLMNEIKLKGEELGQLVEKLRGMPGNPGGQYDQPDGMVTVDQRWVSIGATDLQTGLMALTRAIAKPTFF